LDSRDGVGHQVLRLTKNDPVQAVPPTRHDFFLTAEPAAGHQYRRVAAHYGLVYQGVLRG
jgi:hypothetical protein